MLSSLLYFIKPVTKVSVTRLSSVLYFMKPVNKVSITRPNRLDKTQY
jgi:hypothetical protein